MATQVQFRGGTTTEHASFNGVAKEVTVDTTKQTLVVQDGSTNGGFPLLRENGAQNLITTGEITIDSDANKLYLGGDQEMQVFHNGTDSYIKDTRNAGTVKIQADNFTVIDKDASQTLLSTAVDGATKIHWGGDSTPKLETTAAGAKMPEGTYFQFNGATSNAWAIGATTGADLPAGSGTALQFHHWDTSAWDKVSFQTRDGVGVPDTKKFLAGDSGDLEILHNGTYSQIKNTTGGLYLENTGEIGLISGTYASGEWMVKAVKDGSVELYYDNKRKFRTVSDGCEINSEEGEAAILSLVADEGDDWNDYSRIRGDQGDMVIELYNGSAWEKAAQFVHGDTSQLFFDGSGPKLETYSNGVKVYNHLRVQGANDENAVINLYADNGDDAADLWQIAGMTDGTFQINQWNGGSWEQIIEATGGGNVELYYNGGKTFETVDGGTKVTGKLETLLNSSDTSFTDLSLPASVGGGLYASNLQGTNGVFSAVSLIAGNVNAVSQSASMIAKSVNDGYAPEIHFTQRTGGNAQSTRLKIASSGSICHYGTTKVQEGYAFELYNGFDDQKARIQNAAGSNYGNIVFKVNHNGTESTALTLDPDGNADFGKHVKLAAGYGINFSANSDASRTVVSNVLDDYEEGTFNPQLGGAANHGSHEISGGGTYTKIGRKVYMQISFQSSDLNNNASGQVIIKNLPFTFVDHTVNSSHTCAGVSCDFATTNVTMPDSGDMNRYVWQLISADGHIKGYIATDGGGMTDWGVDNFTAYAMELRLNITGITAT